MSAQSIPLYQPVITAGRVVKLNDGRIGMIDAVAPSLIAGESCQRAYVIGIEKEFADWVKLEQIAIVYGVVATTTTEAAAVA